ncbi:putative ribonuclease H-like superfamily, exonuclease, RNase T/DNA polymerase III [Helianthus annuus]|nr:putative ribonuclease H-like superfamily, exonuclease, RNase T/DNA polymerase III [Helianthus annuus]
MNGIWVFYLKGSQQAIIGRGIDTLQAYNGITANNVVSCPTFPEIADKVYDILHGRVWAGHNIVEFDCVRLKEAYAQINGKPPVPKGTMDTLKLLIETFGRRTDNMKEFR